MKSKLKNKIGAALLVFCICSSTFIQYPLASENVNPFTLLEQQGYRIVTSGTTYSLEELEINNIESNVLFDKQTFVSVLNSQAEMIREAIYNGNIIAVFDDSNKNCGYEKAMGLPIGFEEECDSLESTHDIIGYIYQADSFGGIHITRVNVGKTMGVNEENSHTFAKELLAYEKRDQNVMKRSGGELDTKYLGSVADYYSSSDQKGDVSVMYEVSTAQGVDHYDYYIVHAYIDATPGRNLYNNGYDVTRLQTGLNSTISGAVLYKTGPNTTQDTTSYQVDIGFSGTQNDGLSGSASYSWQRSTPSVTISKVVKSTRQCEWEVDIDDWSAAAESTLSFEPGGTFRIAENNNAFTIHGYTQLIVDKWNELPSVAVMDTTSFYCTDDTIVTLSE